MRHFSFELLLRALRICNCGWVSAHAYMAAEVLRLCAAGEKEGATLCRTPAGNDLEKGIAWESTR